MHVSTLQKIWQKEHNYWNKKRINVSPISAKKWKVVTAWCMASVLFTCTTPSITLILMFTYKKIIFLTGTVWAVKQWLKANWAKVYTEHCSTNQRSLQDHDYFAYSCKCWVKLQKFDNFAFLLVGQSDYRFRVIFPDKAHSPAMGNTVNCIYLWMHAHKTCFHVTSNVWVSGVKLWSFPAQMWTFTFRHCSKGRCF